MAHLLKGWILYVSVSSLLTFCDKGYISITTHGGIYNSHTLNLFYSSCLGAAHFRVGIQVEALVHDHYFTAFCDIPSLSVTSLEMSELMQEKPI